MKNVHKLKTIFILLLMILVGVSTLKAQLKIGYHYKIKDKYKFGGSLPLFYNIPGPDIVKSIPPSKRYLKAFVSPADSVSGNLKVKFWQINKANDDSVGSLFCVNSNDSTDNFYFQIPKQKTLGNPNIYYSIPFVLTEFGVLTIPFKYRFGQESNNIPNNVSTDINGGIYFGRKWGRQRFYYDKSKNHESASFTLAAFSGPTKIELTEKNVNDTTNFKRDSNELGISLGAGAMYSYRNINIGFFGGWDFPLSTAGKNWYYSNKFWIGFGIGYSLSMLSGSK